MTISRTKLFMAFIMCAGFSVSAEAVPFKGCVAPLVQSVFNPKQCVNSVMNIDLTNPAQAYPQLLTQAAQINTGNALLQQQINNAQTQFSTAMAKDPAAATVLAQSNVQSMQAQINQAQTDKMLGQSTTSFENSFGRSTVSQSLKLNNISSQATIKAAQAAAAAAGVGNPSYLVRESLIDSLLNVSVMPTAVSCTCTTTYCSCVPARMLQYSYKIQQMQQDVQLAKNVSQAWRNLAKDVKDTISDTGNRIDTAVSSSSQAVQEQKAQLYNEDEKASYQIQGKVIERVVNQEKEFSNAQKTVEAQTKKKSQVFAHAQRTLDSKGLTRLKRNVAKKQGDKFPNNEDADANIFFKQAYSQHEADAAALFIDHITLANSGLATKFSQAVTTDDVTAKDSESNVAKLETYVSLPRYLLDKIHSERVRIKGLADKLDIPTGIFGSDISLLESYYKLSGMEEPDFWTQLWSSIVGHRTVHKQRVLELQGFRNMILTKIYEQQELNGAMYAAYISNALEQKTKAANVEIQRRD